MAKQVKRWADSNEVRKWASDLGDEDRKRLGIEGIDISPRGRFHTDVVRAFNRVHRSEGVRYVPIGRNQPRLPEVFEEADREDERPTVHRQPRQRPEVKPKEEPAPEPRQETVTPPTPLPVPQASPMMMAMATGVPEPVMELLRQGQQVVVVYVPLPMSAAV